MGDKSVLDFIKHYRENSKDKKQISSMNLEKIFEVSKDLYGEENLEQYENDKKIFKVMQDEANEEADIKYYPDESGYMILKHHSDSILNILNQNKIKLDYDIKYASFQNEDISLVGISNFKFKSNELLIGMSRKLIDYIYILSRIITEELPLKREADGTINIFFNKSKINDFINENRSLNEKFLDLLQKSFIGFSKDIDKIIYKKDEVIELSELLWGNAELFIIAHEYAHACCKHVGKEIKNLTIEELRKDESEADNLAIQIVVAHNIETRGSAIPAYLGIGLLFGSIEIITDIKGNKGAYAKPKERMYELECFIKIQDNTDISESWMVADYLYNFVKCLWDKNKERYKELEAYHKN